MSLKNVIKHLKKKVMNLMRPLVNTLNTNQADTYFSSLEIVRIKLE